MPMHQSNRLCFLYCFTAWQITGIPEDGVSRENLKEAVSKFGTAVYVDFSFGKKEAWIRCGAMRGYVAPCGGCGSVFFGAGQERHSFTTLDGYRKRRS